MQIIDWFNASVQKKNAVSLPSFNNMWMA